LQADDNPETKTSAWWRVVVNWICGIEKQLQPSGQLRVDMSSLDEVPFYRTLCGVNAIALMALAVFVCAFFA